MAAAKRMQTLTGLTKVQLLKVYPELRAKFYALPPCHFNECKYKEEGGGKQKDYFEQEPKPNNQSKLRGDESEQRVLCALQHFFEEGQHDFLPVFIFSGVTFENVLTDRPVDYVPSRRRRRPKSERERAEAEDVTKGQADLLVVSRKSGIIIIEVKSAGDLKRDNPKERERDIKTALDKFVGKLQEKREFGEKFTEKLGLNVHVTVLLALPNVLRADLKKILDADPKFPTFAAALSPGMAPSSDKLTALDTRCLCEDELPPRCDSTDPDRHRLKDISAWWQRFTRSLGDTGPMSASHYEMCVAAFVGPKSRITIWSPKDKRITSFRSHVRTQDEAVHETGARFAMYVLRPEQVRTLESGAKRVYLSGPPGSGKTMLMILKAVHWIAEEQRHIIIISSDIDNNVTQPVALETKEKIMETLKRRKKPTGTSPGLQIPAPNREPVWVCSSYGTTDPNHVICEVLKYLTGKGIDESSTSFLVDEIIDDKSREVVNLLKRRFKGSHIWCAGPWRKDKPKECLCKELPESLRCPPTVQTLLSQTEKYCHKRRETYSYTKSGSYDDRPPLSSDGLPIKWLSHQGHDGLLNDCTRCGQNLGCYLIRVFAGTRQQGQENSDTENLTLGDVLIVSPRISLKKTAFLKALRNKGVKVRVVEPGSGKEDTVVSLADHAVATDICLVAGLERMIVVFVPDNLGLAPVKRSQRDQHQDRQILQRLAGLGKDNCEALWYILSRCLSQAVVFHFGEADLTEDDNDTSSSSSEDEDNEGEGKNDDEDTEINDDNDRVDDDAGRGQCKKKEKSLATQAKPDESGGYKKLIFVIIFILFIMSPCIFYLFESMQTGNPRGQSYNRKKTTARNRKNTRTDL